MLRSGPITARRRQLHRHSKRPGGVRRWFRLGPGAGRRARKATFVLRHQAECAPRTVQPMADILNEARASRGAVRTSGRSGTWERHLRGSRTDASWVRSTTPRTRYTGQVRLLAPSPRRRSAGGRPPHDQAHGKLGDAAAALPVLGVGPSRRMGTPRWLILTFRPGPAMSSTRERRPRCCGSRWTPSTPCFVTDACQAAIWVREREPCGGSQGRR